MHHALSELELPTNTAACAGEADTPKVYNLWRTIIKTLKDLAGCMLYAWPMH